MLLETFSLTSDSHSKVAACRCPALYVSAKLLHVVNFGSTNTVYSNLIENEKIIVNGATT